MRRAHENKGSVSHTRFQLPDTTDTKSSIDLFSECHVECISPSSLATLWRAHKEDMRSSTSFAYAPVDCQVGILFLVHYMLNVELVNFKGFKINTFGTPHSFLVDETLILLD
jgi:hypothetical protein